MCANLLEFLVNKQFHYEQEIKSLNEEIDNNIKSIETSKYDRKMSVILGSQIIILKEKLASVQGRLDSIKDIYEKINGNGS